MPYLTIDFHDTLVECDHWFELEIRTLVSAVLDWTATNHGFESSPTDRTEADAAYRTLRLAIHHHGHELDAVRSTLAVFGRLGIQMPREMVSEAIDALMREALDEASPVPGAQQLLEEIRNQGVRTAIVSSAVHHGFLEWALERFGMRRHLDAVITSASSGYYKSRPEIYWTALDAIGGRPDMATHLGDSLRFDVGGATQAGMRSVWFDRKQNGVKPESDIQPDLVLTSLRGASASVLDLLAEQRSSKSEAK